MSLTHWRGGPRLEQLDAQRQYVKAEQQTVDVGLRDAIRRVLVIT